MSQITYTLNASNTVISTSDGRFIPVSAGNGDFDQLIVQLESASLAVQNADGSYTFTPDNKTLFAYPELSLAVVIANANSSIDDYSYNARLNFISPNKDGTYVLKLQQAQAYVAAGYPTDLTNYPYVQSECVRLGLDSTVAANQKTAADGLVTIGTEWISIDAQIEGTSLAGKYQIGNATDAATVASLVVSTQQALNTLVANIQAQQAAAQSSSSS